MSIMKYIYSLIVFISVFADPDINGTFITFSVGQGNCQLAKYNVTADNSITGQRETKIISFLIDAGSTGMDFDNRLREYSNDWIPLFDKINPGLNDSDIKNLVDANLKKIKGEDGSFGENSKITSIKKGEKGETFTAIQRLNKELTGVNLLFIFLSHTDRDHINWVEKISFIKESNKNKIISFLGGDWHQGDSCKKEGTASKIRNFLDKNTHMYTPYYWNNQTKINAKFFSGNIIDLLNKQPSHKLVFSSINNQYNVENHDQNTSIMNKFLGAGTTLHTLKDYVKVLDPYIYILSMNTYANANNKNTGSSIISFIFPYHNQYTSHITTGDAEKVTVDKMIEEIKKKTLYKNGDEKDYLRKKTGKFNLVKYKYFNLLTKVSNDKHVMLKLLKEVTLNPIHDVILTVPHHGSTTNNQNNALNLLVATFMPNRLIISAGSGSAYTHPNEECSALNNETMKINSKAFDKRNHQRFSMPLICYKEFTEQKYNNILEMDRIGAFSKKNTKGKLVYIKSSVHMQYPYIWSTYYNGDIKFDSISGNFSVKGPSIKKFEPTVFYKKKQ